MKKFFKKIIPPKIWLILRNIVIAIYKFCALSLLYFIKPWAFLYKICRNQKIYVLTEKRFGASDNAYYFYKYLKERKFKCFFILTKSSDDLSNIMKDDVIYPNTIRHYFYIQTANYVLYEDLLYLPDYINIHKNRISGKLIFLQHGIIMNDTPYYFNSNFDLFVTSTKQEQKFIMKMTNCGADKIILTGLARFDDVYNNSLKNSKIILIVPTWRRSLQNKEDLINSLYLKKWTSLLHNQKLTNFCKNNNYEIILYPHNMVRKFLGDEAFDYNKVKKKGWSLHNLLMNCSLAVTDYSSCVFDVAYQMKPVLYYQFDQKDFFNNHLGHGYYDYKKGIGYYYEDETLLVDKIIHLAKHGIDEELRNNIKSFFYKIDDKNCERLFNEITKI